MPSSASAFGRRFGSWVENALLGSVPVDPRDAGDAPLRAHPDSERAAEASDQGAEADLAHRAALEDWESIDQGEGNGPDLEEETMDPLTPVGAAIPEAEQETEPDLLALSDADFAAAVRWAMAHAAHGDDLEDGPDPDDEG